MEINPQVAKPTVKYLVLFRSCLGMKIIFLRLLIVDVDSTDRASLSQLPLYHFMSSLFIPGPSERVGTDRASLPQLLPRAFLCIPGPSEASRHR